MQNLTQRKGPRSVLGGGAFCSVTEQEFYAVWLEGLIFGGA